ncbi:hypothetical protein ACWD4B_23545, partial [Streptomyces sp. NPDC002536]
MTMTLVSRNPADPADVVHRFTAPGPAAVAAQVHQAWRRLTGTAAGPISVLADEVGWSRQHL